MSSELFLGLEQKLHRNRQQQRQPQQRQHRVSLDLD